MTAVPMKVMTYFLIAAMFSAACAPDAVNSKAGEALLDTAPTLTELVKRSEVIIVGTVLREDAEWNMARGATLATESLTKVILAQTYIVAVETSLKGSGEVTIAVPKASGLKGRTLTSEENWSPPQIGQRYVLFLMPNAGTAIYGLPAEPSRFRLGPQAIPESRWKDASRYFPPQPSQSFINAVTEAIKIR